MSVSSSGSAAYSGSLEGSNAQRGLWSSRLAFILAATGSAVGLGNIWKFPYVTGEKGKTIFDLLDFFTANILLPLGGLLVALMAGWVMSKPAMEKELALSPGTFNLWFVTVRFITPIAVGVVFIYNLM